MLPNMDPKTMKNLMDKMGMKSEEIDAARVIIEGPEKTIVIDNPQVTKITMQGVVQFTVAGNISEESKDTAVEITEDDITLVSETTGVTDRELVRETLEKEKGNIAKAILDLENKESK